MRRLLFILLLIQNLKIFSSENSEILILDEPAPITNTYHKRQQPTFDSILVTNNAQFAGNLEVGSVNYQQSATFNNVQVNGNEIINGNLTVHGNIIQKNSLTGNQGATGAPGKTGATGLTGPGILGVTGDTGATGAQGINGSQGSSGNDGIQGFSMTGLTGATGALGDTGSQGSTGNTGSTGVTGGTGSSGNTGSIGNQGNVGNFGNTGSTGIIATGAMGNTGIPGNIGSSGSTGATGLTGFSDTGSTGASGITGYTGSTGNVGASGQTGSQNITGATGNTGNQGAMGSIGYSGNTGAIGAAIIGQAGGTGATGNSGLSGYSGNSGYSGATGMTGSTGIQGNAGFTGSTGSVLTGNTGNNGSSGSTGSSGYSGNMGSTGFSITGNTGNTGMNGATGNIGSQGNTGGSNTGSTGNFGNTGSSGASGATGYTGSTGINVPGSSGSSGSSGVTGLTGSTGNTGAIGATGNTGNIGNTGSTGSTGNTGLGATGNTGLTGGTGALGTTGNTGAVGGSIPAATGATGNLGQTGSSYGTLTIENLASGATGISTAVTYSEITNYNFLTASVGSAPQVNYSMAAGTTGLNKIINLSNDKNGPVEINTNVGSIILSTLYRKYGQLIFNNSDWRLLKYDYDSNAKWFVTTQQGSKLSGTVNSEAGWSVSLSADGNILAVGEPGSNSGKGGAAIYARSGSTWNLLTTISGTGGSGTVQLQGTSVSLSGDGRTLAIGGPDNSSNAGAVWIFIGSGSSWTQKQIITSPDASAKFGSSVALSADGNTLAIGGPQDTSGAGATWIYVTNNSWATAPTLQQKLVGTGATGTVSNQGTSVALSADGNTVAIGGPLDNPNTAHTLGYGATWIFTRSGTTWTQQGSKLIGTGNAPFSNQGMSVSLSADGNTLAVGGPEDNSNIGATWIFTRSGTIWTQQGSKLIGTGYSGTGPFQGWSVSLSSDGNTLAVGAYEDGAKHIGAVWIFARIGSTWYQLGTKLVGTGYSGTINILQGYSVSLSADGNTLAIGAWGDNSSQGATWIFV